MAFNECVVQIQDTWSSWKSETFKCNKDPLLTANKDAPGVIKHPYNHSIECFVLPCHVTYPLTLFPTLPYCLTLEKCY